MKVLGFFAIVLLVLPCPGLEAPDVTLLSAHHVRVSWHAEAGSFYYLQYSTNLTDWDYVPVVEHGADNTASYGFDPVEAEVLYIRLEASTDDPDGDQDGDGISNYDEKTEYGTDPDDDDSDDDGLKDGVELTYGTDPAKDDSDDDGVLDNDETLIAWLSIRREISNYDYEDYPPEDDPQKILETGATWPGAQVTSEALPAAIAYSSLSATLAAKQAFPVNFPADVLDTDLSTAGTAETLPDPACHHASLLHRQIVVRTNKPAAESIDFKAILVTERVVNGQELPKVYEVVPFTISKNATESEPYELIPSFQAGGLADEDYFEAVNQSLLPMEVQEKAPETGFDDFLRFDPLSNPTNPWLMVPAGGVDENSFLLKGLDDTELDLAGTVAAVQVDPDKTGQQDPLTVTVSGNVEGDDEGVIINGDARLVDLAFYPKRTVDIKIFELTLVRADGTKITPIFVPSGAQVRDCLNRIFGKQCNVFFNIADQNTKIEVAFDVGDPDGLYADYTSWPDTAPPLRFRTPGNETFDFIAEPSDFDTAEELLVRAAGWDETVKANIYFVGQKASVLHETFPNRFHENWLFNGIAIPEKKMIVIPWVGTRPMNATLQTIAHEIGHMPLSELGSGLFHPRLHPEGTVDPRGVPLKTPELDYTRLMSAAPTYSIFGAPIPGRVHPDTQEPYALLIKEEWDVIHGLVNPPE